MSNLPKTYISGAGWFELHIPKNWDATESEKEVAFFDPREGIGTMQISAFVFPESEKPNLKALLVEYLQDRGVQIEHVFFSVKPNSSKRIIQADFEQDSRYWRIWISAGCTVLLFVTYNCPAKELKELSLVEAMIDTLKIK